MGLSKLGELEAVATGGAPSSFLGRTRGGGFGGIVLMGVFWGIVLVGVFSACPGPPPVRAHATGGLVIVCKPRSAQIFIDDRYQGTVAAVAERPLMLPVGTRRVELRKDGYFSAYHEVTIARGVRQTLSVILQKEPY